MSSQRRTAGSVIGDMVKRKRVYAPMVKRAKKYSGREYFPLSRMGAPSGVPTQNVVSMRYCSYLVQTTGVTPTANFFRANGPFDPDEGIGGGQPMGWDNMQALYNHHVVLGAKITVRFNCTTNDYICCGIFLDDNASIAYTSYEGLIEAKKGPWTTFAGLANGSRMLTNTFSAKKYFNTKNPEDNTSIQAATNAAPSNQAHFGVWTQAVDRASALTIECVITLDYIVKFMEPKDIARS